MSNKKRLFGTFGVRRTANDVLTPEFATRLAACYGTQIQGTVAVGGDTRTSTPMLMEAVKAGLLSSGCGGFRNPAYPWCPVCGSQVLRWRSDDYRFTQPSEI